jgi:hypothetical protein
MLRPLCGALIALLLACGKEAEKPALQRPTPAAAELPAPAASPPGPAQVAPTAPAAPAATGDLQSLLARLSFKPDPYETQPGCVSEPRVQVKDELLLTVRMRLGRAADGSLEVTEAAYQVSDTRARPPAESAASLGIPRLELVRADGSTLSRDFRGEYAEPGDARRRLSSEEPPRDPTWVEAWLASAPVAADVVAHRVSLDGRVLSEVKRPVRAPGLSHIECDDTRAEGVKLSWEAHSDDARAPLLVDVLRGGPLGLVEALPLSDARKVDALVLPASPEGADRDAVLLVSVTDTFRLVSRGVLVPKKAL